MRTIFFLAIILMAITTGLQAQKPVNWTSKELMEPATLAATIREGKKLPTIISIGPGATIPHSLHIGMINNKEGLEQFKATLAGLAKEKAVVIYCGCCPFEHCPNVRPAIDLLKKNEFTQFYLLNLPHNIKRDWIDKGYPMAGKK